MHAAIVFVKSCNRSGFGHENIKADVASVRVVKFNGPDINELFRLLF